MGKTALLHSEKKEVAFANHTKEYTALNKLCQSLTDSSIDKQTSFFTELFFSELSFFV